VITGTAGAGLLARGTLSFSESDGTITGVTMSQLSSYTAASAGNDQTVLCTAAGGALASTDAAVTVNNADEITTANDGTLVLNFDGTNWTVSGASTATGSVVTGSSSKITLDLGATATNSDITVDLSQVAVNGDSITLTLTGSGDWTAQATADVNADGYFTFNADFIGGTGTDQDIAFESGIRYNGSAWVPESLATTQYASSSTTVFQSADGYGAGSLQGVDVDVDGLITGSYSNGQVIPLYQLALAKFQSVTSLKKLGGNLYSETRESGQATTSLAGTNGLGSISPNSLEQSNVDIADEFVKMITTQRGFQANSKIITVTDDMLSELINLKR